MYVRTYVTELDDSVHMYTAVYVQIAQLYSTTILSLMHLMIMF